MIWIGRCAGDSRCSTSGSASARDGGVILQPEQLLHPDGEHRSVLRLVVDGVAIAGRRLEMRRALGVEPPGEVPGQQRRERAAKIVGA